MRKTIAVAVCLAALAICAAAQPAGKDPRSVLGAYVSAWNHHDFAAMDRLLGANSVHDDIALAVHAQGPAQIKDFMKSIIAQEPDLKWQIDRVIVSGSSIAAEWTWSATFSGDGPYGPVKDLPISGHGVSIVVVENGRLKHLTDYYDTMSFFPKPSPKK